MNLMTTLLEASVVEGSRVVFTDQALEQMRWMLGFMWGGQKIGENSLGQSGSVLAWVTINMPST